MNDSDARTLNEAVLDELRASVGGDRGFVVDLIDAYLADGATQVAEVEAAIDDGSVEALVRPAHTLKSSSATVGAEQLAATARALELAGRSGSIDEGARQAAAGLRASWEAATEALRAWIERGRDR